MTTTPPTWAELHAMVPELGPKGPSGGSYGQLARDSYCFAAVEWMASKCGGIVVVPPHNGRDWRVRDNWMPPMMEANGPTLDAALRAAVAAVAGDGK